MSLSVPVAVGLGGPKRSSTFSRSPYLASAHETVEGAAKRLAFADLSLATSDFACFSSVSFVPARQLLYFEGLARPHISVATPSLSAHSESFDRLLGVFVAVRGQVVLKLVSI